MIFLHVEDEVSQLKTVILGTAMSNGTAPLIEECYDPKSMHAIKTNQYPLEQNMKSEIQNFSDILEKYGVEVLQPEVIQDYNQIFVRDLGFVIEDKLFKSNMIEQRSVEWQGLESILQTLNSKNIIAMSDDKHIEGGDVILWRDYIFIGTYTGSDYSQQITARTNLAAVEYLQHTFPHKKVMPFNLIKSNYTPQENALHLDCVFQPVGRSSAILYEGGFLEKAQLDYLVNLFGKDNIFFLTNEEMLEMNANVFSIAEDIVVSETKATRLNTWLRDRGITVEEINYKEIPKQGGALRCSTLPLARQS